MNRLKPLFSSASEEWYTPEGVIEVVDSILGGIDLDPCADPGKRVPAASHRTREDDGLTASWEGRVFVNPPYGTALARWVAKFVDEYAAGTMTAGVLLCPARPDTRWFDRLAAYPRCYIRGRLTFHSPDGVPADPAGFPSMLVYAGSDMAKFCRATSRLGRVYPGAIDTVPQRNAEKRAAVLALLSVRGGNPMSDRAIARLAGVSHTYVARLRRMPRTETVVR